MHPGSILKWWLMTDVLVVATGEFGDPVAIGVHVEARYCPVHSDEAKPVRTGSLHEAVMVLRRYESFRDAGESRAQASQLFDVEH